MDLINCWGVFLVIRISRRSESSLCLHARTLIKSSVWIIACSINSLFCKRLQVPLRRAIWVRENIESLKHNKDTRWKNQFPLLVILPVKRGNMKAPWRLLINRSLSERYKAALCFRRFLGWPWNQSFHSGRRKLIWVWGWSYWNIWLVILHAPQCCQRQQGQPVEPQFVFHLAAHSNFKSGTKKKNSGHLQHNVNKTI